MGQSHHFFFLPKRNRGLGNHGAGILGFGILNLGIGTLGFGILILGNGTLILGLGILILGPHARGLGSSCRSSTLERKMRNDPVFYENKQKFSLVSVYCKESTPRSLKLLLYEALF